MEQKRKGEGWCFCSGCLSDHFSFVVELDALSPKSFLPKYYVLSIRYQMKIRLMGLGWLKFHSYYYFKCHYFKKDFPRGHIVCHVISWFHLDKPQKPMFIRVYCSPWLNIHLHSFSAFVTFLIIRLAQGEREIEKVIAVDHPQRQVDQWNSKVDYDFHHILPMYLSLSLFPIKVCPACVRPLTHSLAGKVPRSRGTRDIYGNIGICNLHISVQAILFERVRYYKRFVRGSVQPAVSKSGFF